MFLSEIHPRVRKELHRRKFILQRTPNDTKKIAQTTSLDPTKENRDLLAESFARSSWIRVFSPINSVFLIDEKWKNELFNIRKVKPLFGEDNRYFEPGGNKDLIKAWNDFSKP